MVKAIQNWLDSVEYDLKTARALLKTKRKVYVVFMCHLAIEKMLKAIFLARFKKVAPHTHNLVHLCNILSLSLSVEFMHFIELINDKSVPTRYPENIAELERKISLITTKEYLLKTEKLIRWLKRNTISLK